ncbi:hypothetical protein N7507_010314 [Penicillium longicatenatum]|nr:hypothetical protein N7507_010314 [Penicillium longicatenatum]
MMHRFQVIQSLLFGLSTASQISARSNSSSYDSSLNFRPDWVSGLGNVYHWVGSPIYSYNSSSPKAEVDFNITLQDTQSAPYNLSSILTDYAGSSSVMFNIKGCNSTETTRWAGHFISLGIEDDNIGYNWTYPNPVLDLQFDGQTANLTVEGYFEGIPLGKYDFNEDDLFVPGKAKLSFSGVIDTYHSDVLVNDSATPSWERSIGFGNDSANVGYNGTDTSVSNSLQSSGTFSILGFALLLSIASCIL